MTTASPRFLMYTCIVKAYNTLYIRHVHNPIEYYIKIKLFYFITFIL